MAKKRKVRRGKLLEELVKGSLDYAMMQVRQAFREQFKSDYESSPYYYVDEIFQDHVIVSGSDLAPDEYYYVPYERDADGVIVFVDRTEWEMVELTYQPASNQVDESKRGEGRRFVEVAAGGVSLVEAAGDGPRRIKAVGITAGVVNGNGRRYPAAVLRAAVDEARTHLHESLGQGRFIPLLGEAEHPSDKSGRPTLLDTVVRWDDIDFDGTNVLLEGVILETSKGRDILALMEGSVMPGVSQRARGGGKIVGKGRDRIEEVTWLKISGYDLVMEPSDPVAGVTMFESQGGDRMDPKEILQALQESGFFDELTVKVREQVDEAMQGRDAKKQEMALREALEIGPEDDINVAVLALLKEKKQTPAAGALETALRESLGLTDTDNVAESLEARMARLTELEEAERARKVTIYVEKQVDALSYPGGLKETLQESILAAKPQTGDEAKALIVEKRREYDAIMSQINLSGRGYGSGLLRVGAPVIESELGIPAFAIAGYALQESLMKSGLGHQWDHRKPRSLNEQFAVRYLERFDEMFRSQLIEEARRYEEAEQTSDLNLPYSVSRAVVAEALPMLVASSIYDFGVTSVSPFRLYYEAFTGETGYSVTVTDEAVTADHDDWVDMTGARITPGTVVVTNSGATTTYVEGTDYVIHCADGKLKALSTGSITDSQSLLVDYVYTAIRKGEMATIERGKLQLTSKTLDAAADRLAQQVSNEAVVFSRSQMGWDATQRTLLSLVNQIRRKIDQGVLYQGLSAALEVASNIAGTWTSATDSLDVLVKYLGQAKVKVWNRYYEPTAIVASVTNADLLSNWDGFKRDGFPDAVLNATGFVGRVKGLPLFASTEFSDAYIEVVNRELVMHRVFQPMTIKGPYPSYDPTSGELIGADQYYGEEFNVTDSPVPEKGALVGII